MTYGGFYKGEKKKPKKTKLEKRAQKSITQPLFSPPQVEIIKRGKKEW